MPYIGYFKDTKDNAYRVMLTPRAGMGSCEAVEITLGGTPFVTSIEGGGDTIYKPVRYSGATVQIVASTYLENIYSATAKGTPVVLYDSTGDVKWTGYATPSLYNQDYSSDRVIFDVECIDGLSVLQYFNFTSARLIISFKDLLRNLLSVCGCYDKMYLPANTVDFSATYISENNFYDEKKYGETDDDVALKCNEVLEAICRYLGVTAVADGASVYFVDYDYLRNSTAGAAYYCVDLLTGEGTDVLLDSGYQINAQSYMGSDNSISLAEVYNKITVKADLKTFDGFIPDIYETCDNITGDDSGTMTEGSGCNWYDNERFSNAGAWCGHESAYITDGKPYNWMLTTFYLAAASGQIRQSRGEYIKPQSVKGCSFLFSRFYKPKSDSPFTLHAYKNGNEVSYPNSMTIYDMMGVYSTSNIVKEHIGFCGAVLARLDKTTTDKKISDIENLSDKTPRQVMDEFALRANKTSVSFKDTLILLNPFSNRLTVEKPMFEMNAVELSSFFGGENAYLVIAGSVNSHYWEQYPWGVDGSNIDMDDGRKKIKRNSMAITCSLNIGGSWWNGVGWQNTECKFRLPYGETAISEDDTDRADNIILMQKNIRNTVKWYMGLKESGYVIPINNVLRGTPHFVMYTNYITEQQNNTKAYPTVTAIEGFSIKSVIGDPTYSDVKNDDTIYTTVIDTANVAELGEISMQINTYDGKESNHSSVVINGADGAFSYLDSVALSGVVEASPMRMEEWLIQRIYKQYSNPAHILDVQLDSAGIKPYTVFKHEAFGKLIIESEQRDWRYNVSTLKLVEKW